MGATPAETATGAQALVTTLLDVATVEAAVSGRDGALPALADDAVWLQTSTVGLGIDALAGVADRHRVRFFDTPVLGTPAMAGQGRLGVLVAGPEAGRERVAALTDAFGHHTLWVGSGTEASRLKLAVNSWVLMVTLAAAEVLALTDGPGLDPNLFLEAIEGTRWAPTTPGPRAAPCWTVTWSPASR